jgi:catechol 1,2-dioxygenase
MVRTDNRVCHLVEELEQTLVDFIRKHDVTHAEYRKATDLIVASVKSGEESLLFDVFLEADSVDNDNSRHQGTIEAIEGPFYLLDAPVLERPYRLPQRADEDGDALIFSGRVADTDGNSIADAELDIWQADATGRYSNVWDDGYSQWSQSASRRSDTPATRHYKD